MLLSILGSRDDCLEWVFSIVRIRLRLHPKRARPSLEDGFSVIVNLG